MFQNKLFNFALIMIISIAMLGVVAIVGFQYFGKSSEAAKTAAAPTAEKLAESQFVVEKITTNLSGSSLIQLGVTLQMDSNKAVGEIGLRKVQVKNTINEILHSTTAIDIQKDAGYKQLEAKIIEGINKYMQHGKVVDVYVTDIVVQ
jgi:flagellar FliL protein